MHKSVNVARGLGGAVDQISRAKDQVVLVGGEGGSASFLEYNAGDVANTAHKTINGNTPLGTDLNTSMISRSAKKSLAGKARR